MEHPVPVIRSTGLAAARIIKHLVELRVCWARHANSFSAQPSWYKGGVSEQELLTEKEAKLKVPRCDAKFILSYWYVYYFSTDGNKVPWFCYKMKLRVWKIHKCAPEMRWTLTEMTKTETCHWSDIKFAVRSSCLLNQPACLYCWDIAPLLFLLCHISSAARSSHGSNSLHM